LLEFVFHIVVVLNSNILLKAGCQHDWFRLTVVNITFNDISLYILFFLAFVVVEEGVKKLLGYNVFSWVQVSCWN